MSSTVRSQCASASHCSLTNVCVAPCSEGEALADLNAFNREYENDNSWEQLQEDEYGHLRPLVSYHLVAQL